MRISLVTHSLWGGGAERVAVAIADGWAEQGHEVVLLTFEGEVLRRHPIHEAVDIRTLGLLRHSHNPLEGLLQNFQRIWVLRRAIRDSKPDIVISFMDRTNVLTLLATLGLGAPVIISEHNDPLHHRIGRAWSALRRITYPLADWLVCPTGAGLAKFRRITKVRGSAIANPIVVPAARGGDQPSGDACGRVLVAMGRLVAEKGFDLLLTAFSRIASRHTDWSLTIIGGGPLRSELERQSRTLELGERVRFAGELMDPFPVLRAADLFVFSSRHEGFGMALAEAMACGLPAVSFDCPDGPGEIVRDGVDGLLVPSENIDALAAALDEVMADDAKRERFASRAGEILERFSALRVLSLWDEVLAELAPAR